MDQLLHVKEQLERNNFEVHIAETSQEAHLIFTKTIFPNLVAKSASYADSKTMQQTGVIEFLKKQHSLKFIDTFNPDDSWKEQITHRKEALTTDLFVTGTNALTESGLLVNLDMIGNRVAALAFGPRNIVLFIGKNKIVKNLDDAFKRVKEIAAPINAKHHENLKVPCQKTGKCSDCSSPHRICNTWTITEKSYPKHRIKIILINEDLGY